MFNEYGELEPGAAFSKHTYDLESDLVSNYLDAVQDQSSPLRDEDGRAIVPAMAVAALSLRGVVQDLRIPGGTLHVGQEFRYSAAVTIGSSLGCEATLVQNSVRGGWRFLVVDCRVTDGGDSEVMRGKSTIMIPAGLGPIETAP